MGLRIYIRNYSDYERYTELIYICKGAKQMEKVKNEEYVICPRCKQEVYKEAIICPFCKFGIMAWLDGKIDENGEEIKDKPK